MTNATNAGSIAIVAFNATDASHDAALSATRCAGLELIARPGGATIAEIRAATGWSIAATRGTFSVWRSIPGIASVAVVTDRTDDNATRVTATAMAGRDVRVADTSRGQFKHGAVRPARGSTAAPVPGAVGHIGVSRMAAAMAAFSAMTVPVADAPVADAPVADAPVADAPVADAPVAVADAPVAVADAPVAVADAPVAVADAPVADAPVADAPVAVADAAVAVTRGRRGRRGADAA